MVKDVLLFQSDAFSLEPPVSVRGVRYDLPTGDDILQFLKERLEEREIHWVIDDPCREDFGAVICLDRDKQALCITASWQGDDAWALVFSERRGFLGWLLDRKPSEHMLESLREVKLLVDEVIRNDPNRFRNVTWIDDDEFPGVAQNFVI